MVVEHPKFVSRRSERLPEGILRRRTAFRGAALVDRQQLQQRGFTLGQRAFRRVCVRIFVQKGIIDVQRAFAVRPAVKRGGVAFKAQQQILAYLLCMVDFRQAAQILAAIIDQQHGAQLAVFAAAVAASGGLNGVVHARQNADNAAEGDVHARFNELRRDADERLARVKRGADVLQNSLAVLGTHRRGQVPALAAPDRAERRIQRARLRAGVADQKQTARLAGGFGGQRRQLGRVVAARTALIDEFGAAETLPKCAVAGYEVGVGRKPQRIAQLFQMRLGGRAEHDRRTANLRKKVERQVHQREQ